MKYLLKPFWTFNKTCPAQPVLESHFNLRIVSPWVRLGVSRFILKFWRLWPFYLYPLNFCRNTKVPFLLRGTVSFAFYNRPVGQVITFIMKYFLLATFQQKTVSPDLPAPTGVPFLPASCRYSALSFMSHSRPFRLSLPCSWRPLQRLWAGQRRRNVHCDL